MGIDSSAPKPITVRDLYEARARALGLELMGGLNGLENPITSARIQKLGLALAGYTDYLHSGRIQFLGGTEIDYLSRLSHTLRNEAISRVFGFNLCGIIVTRGLDVPPELIEHAINYRVPVLRTSTPSSRAIDIVTEFLEERLAPFVTIHGGLLDVFGLGVLIIGDSGVGKSECALDLILRGHRLVSDDVVTIKRLGAERLVGTGPSRMQFHMELRGLGIINIKDLFGISAVSPRKELDLVVQLVRWDPGREYDRLGLDDAKYELLNVSLPLSTMPVASGRNVATLVEVAVRLEMLKKQGYRPAEEFVRQLELEMEKERSKHE